jgi:amino acid adenylation domain-containing protein
MNDLSARIDGLTRDERAALLEKLRQKKKAAAVAMPGDEAPLVRVPRTPRDPAAGLPLSSSQERLWFLDRLTPGTATYNLPYAMRLVGPLDRTVLARCFEEVLRRHEVLRTTFALHGDAPVQIIHPPEPFVLPLVDLAGLSERVRRAEADRLADAWMTAPFDLERGPLLRVVLLRLAPREHGLLLSKHHIITDGWSKNLLLREITVLYEAFAGGRPSPLPELPVQYADVAVWQRERLRGPALQGQLAWWRERLAGAPEALDLPLDRARPAVQTFRGEVLRKILPPALADRLRELARSEKGSLFMVLLAGLDLVLQRWSGQDDVVVGTPIAGRVRSELENLIGFFLNTLALRVDVSGDPTGRALVGRAREAALGAFAHQEIPFEKLLEDLRLERDLSRTPLFQVFLNLLNFPDAKATLPGGLVLESFGDDSFDSKFDLTIYANELPEGLAFTLVHNADLFDRVRIEELARQLRQVLEQLVERPDAPVSSYSLLTAVAESVLPDPRSRLGDEWVGAVHALFAGQAQVAPERTAVMGVEESWTYGELAEGAARLAARLQTDGLRPEEPVAIWADRSPSLVWAVLGTLWAGGAFVILDPAYPAARLAEMIRLAAPRYWIGLDSVGAPPAEVEKVLTALRGRVTLPSTLSLEALPEPVPPAAVAAESLAYIAFTSGSTGAPKGILGRHGPLSHFLPFQRERFGLGADDRISLLSGLSHDPLQRDIFTPLSLGGTVCVPAVDDIVAGLLAAWMQRQGITVAHLTPAMGQLLTEGAAGISITSLRWVLLVGDVLTRLDVDRLRRLAPQVTCVNLYGSTETQRAVAHHVVEEREIADARAPQVLPLGRGMPDVQLLVMSRTAPGAPPRLAGVGEVGEIWVRSPHLARGYLGDEALTADRFRGNPFTAEAGDRIYRTGDLGRYRPDGEVTFAGRADQQVKIRGFRIELGEIQAALGRLPGVREAVVLPRETAPGDRHLVAYVVREPGKEPNPDELREALGTRLPSYMVPAGFVLLDRLPVTPNGKVDRRALAKIAPERTTDDYLAPRTPTEETLARLWAELLGPERTGARGVGVRDNFFALGGHSLLATRLLAAVRDAMEVDLPLRIVFERPTLERMAEAIDAARASGTETAAAEEPIVRQPRTPGASRFPVSFSQLREWILDRLEPGNPAYNLPNNLRIGGPLSIPVLTAALNRLVARHEVFRTEFAASDDEPLQVVRAELRLDVPVIDLSALPERIREEELWRRVRHQAATGFDLAQAPLFRARVVRLGAEDHALLMTVHHIISDGWSTGILNRELAALYDAEPLPPLPVQYADYTVWQRKRLDGEGLERQVGYWRERLAGAPPLLELPTDRPRPPVRSNRGARLPFLLPRPLVDRLQDLARQQGATLFMVLLAGYQTLLARWSGQDDVVVGTYSSNRPRRELEGLIGFFINTLVLRTDLAEAPSFRDLLGRVRETTLGAYAHRDLPFEKLLETLQLPRDPSRTPLFQALLVLQNFPPTRVELSTGVRLSGMAVGIETSDYDLAFWLGEGPDGIGGALEYSLDLFDEPAMARFAAHLRTLLEAAVAAPDRDVWTLPLLTPDEQESQRAAWSRGPAVPDGPPLLHHLVEEQAARTPAAVALESGSVRLTYVELVDRARELAGFLREQGIGPGKIVALSAERTPELIVRMLAVLQAGAAYLPVDPGYPQERREFMVGDSGAVEFKGDKVFKDTKDDKGASSLALVSLESLPSMAFSSSPAYLIYTSGSTGRPKGVVVPHNAIAAFTRAARAAYDLAPGDRVLQFASISFDTSAEEIWPALSSGATLVLRPDDMATSIPHFLRELERLGISVLDLPTAFWHEMVAGMEAEDLALPRGLRLVILGGEEALADRFALWRRRVGSGVRLVNTYGPTETTIVATRRELSGLAPGAAVPIGWPIPGACGYVLDRFLEPVPAGVRGELWIGGSGVAQGYLGRPDLTAERFLPDPFAQEAGARLYRTGDLAVLRPDGDLVFAGRADRQLKVRGYRIEPGEIEAALRLHPALRDAVVDVRGPRDGQRLIAWIVPHEGAEAPAAADLRAFLRDRLPEPLLPAAFAPLAALPLTPSGKVDRRALAEPAEIRPDNVSYAEPQSALERSIAGIYADLLRVGRVGLHDNFFDLGGHSLLIVRAHQKLKEALGREIPVVDLFRFPTVAALARHLGGEDTGSLQKVQSLAEQQRAAQQRQRAAMERLRRPGGPGRR